jgi:hypothetical protein
MKLEKNFEFTNWDLELRVNYKNALTTISLLTLFTLMPFGVRAPSPPRRRGRHAGASTRRASGQNAFPAPGFSPNRPRPRHAEPPRAEHPRPSPAAVFPFSSRLELAFSLSPLRACRRRPDPAGLPCSRANAARAVCSPHVCAPCRCRRSCAPRPCSAPCSAGHARPAPIGPRAVSPHRHLASSPHHFASPLPAMAAAPGRRGAPTSALSPPKMTRP